MSQLEYVFIGLVVLGLYPFVLYPILAGLLARFVNRQIRRDAAYLPRVTVITAAYNEARHIEQTVRNKLMQDYPRELLQIIVVSDGSDDGTDDIVRRIAAEDGRVQLIRQEPRQGKTAGLNLAVAQATGDILVFSDANSIYRPDALRMLVRQFADARVGYVTGQMLYVNPDGSLVGDGCSAYMRYENFLRQAESRFGSVIGVDGGVDAVRRALYRPMRADQLPDFVLPLRVVGQDHLVAYEPAAVLNEDTLTNSSAEYRMRVRVALRAYWALWDERHLLNPFKRPLFAWQLWSHKVLRYLSFAPLAIAAVMSWLFINSSLLFVVAAGVQVLVVLGILGARVVPRVLGAIGPVRYAQYFLLLNVSSAVAFGRFLLGHKQVIWQPRKG